MLDISDDESCASLASLPRILSSSDDELYTIDEKDEDSDAEGDGRDPFEVIRAKVQVRSGDVVKTVRRFVADRAEKQSDDGAMQVQAASMAEKAAA